MTDYSNDTSDSFNTYNNYVLPVWLYKLSDVICHNCRQCIDIAFNRYVNLLYAAIYNTTVN